MNSKHWIEPIPDRHSASQQPWYEVTNVDEVASPALLVYPERVETNVKRMVALAGSPDRLRPHVKTHKMSEVVRLKLAAGVTKFKAATIAEAEMTAEAGARDILLAVQPVGPTVKRLTRLVESFPSCKFACLVDNMETLHEMTDNWSRRPSRLPVWLDVNVGMNRTGVVPGLAATEIVQSLLASESLELAGLHVYDGHLHVTDVQELKAMFDASLSPFWEWYTSLDSELGVQLTIAAGGTPTSALWQEVSLLREVAVETGAGTTVFWDSGQPTFSPPMDYETAALIMARVISRPTPTSVCLDLGHKAVASEMPWPRVAWLNLRNDGELVTHNEEHLVLNFDRSIDLKCGAVIYGVPTHVCPTVALHQHAHCVQEGRVTTRWKVAARDRELNC
ncbi:D-TA family PLP-dependent enzyme [Rhodopirellula sp. JC740]|uniref:D-TA family PLP-dependent enzyme n=1 Tax=Rhodopirellula halodulae TaxID=2894198 RepID=A0ABS8NER2_9BACT|nr:D-TA family PLP-dependent enzyme [Rhodopirellula sp. JC740]MCC9641422.1 D-TA family PLP-dependent enzyme [Rhodopirellula sp. JC740]